MRNDSRKGQEYNDEVIGLTGLIMPSLDEMVVVAKKMSKGGFKQPLLIGGATTSKMHTAVKISPNYFTLEHPAIHVLVASRFVTVLSSLLSDSKEEFLEDIMEECDEMREEYYAGVENRYFFLTFEQAQEQKFTIDFDSSPVAPAPPQDGNYCDRYCHAGRCGTIWIGILFSDLGAACGRYTNRGYPKISNDEAVGAKAKKLFDDA